MKQGPHLKPVPPQKWTATVVLSKLLVVTGVVAHGSKTFGCDHDKHPHKQPLYLCTMYCTRRVSNPLLGSCSICNIHTRFPYMHSICQRVHYDQVLYPSPTAQPLSYCLHRIPCVAMNLDLAEQYIHGICQSAGPSHAFSPPTINSVTARPYC